MKQETSLARRTLLKSSLCAMASAGLLGSASAAQSRTTTGSKEHKFDVVVVGAGCAGLVCAIEAHDLGASVCVIEKADRPDGNAIFSLGGICAWGTNIQKAAGVKDTFQDFYDSMMKVSSYRADPHLTRTYAEHISEDVDWLWEKMGVPFMEEVYRNPWPKLGREIRTQLQGLTGGAVLIQTLLKQAQQRKIPFFYERKAVKLLTGERGEVTGVRTLNDEIGYETFIANGGVLLATGGFSANSAMVDRYIGGWASRLALRGSRNTTGENVTLTEPLFAKMMHMDQFHSGPIISETHVNPADILNSGYGVIVSLQGKRFVDESATYIIKAKGCARLTAENRAYCIVDSQCKPLDRVIPTFDKLNSPYGKADTLEELCKKVGLPVEETLVSLKKYNDAVKAGKLDKLDPPNHYVKPVVIEKGPFYAVPYEGGMTATFGGPLINVKAEVQNLEGHTIRGLYAAGNAAGGLFFNDYIGGSQLGAATVFGRIAAREMKKRAKA